MLLSGAMVGAWQPCLVAHLNDLGFSEFQLALALSTAPVATMLSPLAGQAADRWVSADRLVAGLAVAGGILFLAVSRATAFLPVLGLLLGALVLSGPLFSLATSLALQNLPAPERDFPFVRAWGTLGHVAGANLLSLWMAASGRGFSDALVLSGLLAFVLAAYALAALPRTPPRRDAAGRSAFRKAASMLRTPSFAVLTACLFVLIVFGTFYYARGPLYLEDSGIPKARLSAFLSIGQATEVLVVFGLGRLYERLGPKRTLLLGLACWVLRFLLFSLGGLPALLGAVALHGACFGCWRIAATMYADRNAERDARSSVQALMGLTADGSGMLLGNFLVGQVMVWGTGSSGPDWTAIWLVPAAGCAAVFAVFVLGFRPAACLRRAPGA
jgi:MFS family permease